MSNIELVNNNKDITVYENKVMEYTDYYIINELDNDTELLYKTSIFNGLLKYLYLNVFKPKKEDNIKYNCRSNINTEDTDLLNDIWNVYCKLCYKYNKKPSIIGYCVFTGISKDTLHTWKTKEYRASSTHSDLVKSWLTECEMNTYDAVANDGSITNMFLLKACFGYREAAQQIEVVNSQTPDATALDIASRRALENAQLPELPELE